MVARANSDNAMRSILDVLKRYAESTNSDYFSYESFGGDFGLFIGKCGEGHIYEVRPRIFRKYVNN